MSKKIIEKTYGIDHGYSGLKFADTEGNKDILRSTYTKGGKTYRNMQKGVEEVEFEGQKYLLGGRKGQYTVSMEKMNSKITEVQTFAAIAKLEEENDADLIIANIVVGVPIVQYQSGGSGEFEKILKGYGQKDIILNGKKKTILIKDIFVFMQGAGAIMLDEKLENETNLILDFGGWTVDIAEFSEGIELEQCSSLPNKGIISFYNDVADRLNIKYNESYIAADAEYFISKEYMPYKGLKVNINDIIQDEKEKYLQSVLNEISTKYKTKNIENIIIIGGAGEFFYEDIKKFEGYTNAILRQDSIYTNALAYAEIGRNAFKEE